MTQKIASRDSKMGRNPFSTASKPSVKSAAEMLDSLSQADDSAGWLERAVSIPIRGLVLGLKSLLVVRYLVAHPKEWKI
jgi:hypothetical protein